MSLTPLSRILLVLVTLSAPVVLPSAAFARGLSDKQIQRLETLSELGQEACDAGDFESCQRAFEQAQALLPWAPHEYYIAVALVGQGQLVEGTALWSRILKENDPDDCHPSVCQAVRKARERLNETEPTIPRVSFEIADDYAALRVKWGEVQLSSDQLEQSGRFNPGSYRLEVTADGYQPFRQTYDLSPGDQQQIRIQLVPEPARAVAQEEPSNWQAPVGIGLSVAGAVALVAAGLTWDSKEDKLAAYKLKCRDGSCERTDPEYSEIDDLTLYANTLFTGGGVLLAAGGALLVWDLSQESTPTEELSAASSRTTIRAAASPQAMRVWVSGSF